MPSGKLRTGSHAQFKATALRCSSSALAIGVAISASALATSTARAADSADAAEPGVVQEVIVTATRREETTRELPMSIVAFSGERLAQSGVGDVKDLQTIVSGLHVSAEAGLTKVALRGIGSDQYSVGADSGVAVHRDGVYIIQRPELGMGFFDVQRVEVLRGPQGTLYGRNATGGSVNIISNAPTDAFTGAASVSYGNYQLVEAEGHVSGPITNDRLLARLSFKTTHRHGYTPNLFDGQRLDNADAGAVRGYLRYLASENLTVDLIADYAADDGRYAGLTTRNRLGVPLVSETRGFTAGVGRQVNQNGPDVNRKEAYGVLGRVTWDIGETRLTSATSFRKFHWFQSLDDDGQPLTLFGFRDETRRTEQFSQELVWASDGDGALSWLIGGFYLHGKEQQDGVLYAPEFFGLRVQYITDRYATDAYAAFAEGAYAVTDRLKVTIGARYSYEKKSVLGRDLQDIPGFGVFADPNTPSDGYTDSWGSFTPKVSVGYALSDSMNAYASVGTGFKAGGYNGGDGRLANPAGAYQPEKVTNYEVGLKSSLLDRRLNANIALFEMRYKNLQQQAFVPSLVVPGTLVNAVINAASSTIRGAEVDMQFSPVRAFSIDGNASYLDATFDNYPNAVNNGAAQDASGNRLPNAPKFSLNVGLNLYSALGDWGQGAIRLEYSHKSRTYYTQFEDAFVSQPGYGLLNAQIRLNPNSERWLLTLWGRNLTDKTYATFVRDSALTPEFGGNRTRYSVGPPRTYGATFRYSF